MINEKTDTKEGYTVVKEESSVGRFDISRIILEEETDFINSENELDESERDEMRKFIILENDLEDELEECEIDEIHRILMIENNLENGLEESECTVASVLYSVSNHVAGVPGMLACLQEYHMCGENQAVKYRPFASIHVLY